ncbi:Aldehyde dehydrogenase family protein [Streptacidiphilus jiangxiensis]|uniref:Aldehyde dehydrogenase family protein n=1 Tax=Streptacidiphilus jiangxiensis TaxID=235985 RepID=A0A1H7WBP9_STRJI|nr:Aldehyde dehydrogenase family protein [Streptacidiphilus jiangxiensis]
MGDLSPESVPSTGPTPPPGRAPLSPAVARAAHQGSRSATTRIWPRAAGPEGVAVARRIRTGTVTVTVNGAPVGFDGPFGGFKDSGIGREYGFAGLNTYLEYKTVTL